MTAYSSSEAAEDCEGVFWWWQVTGGEAVPEEWVRLRKLFSGSEGSSLPALGVRGVWVMEM